jgi:hypothetical protein
MNKIFFFLTFIAVIALSNSLLSQENRSTDSAFNDLNILNKENKLDPSVNRLNANNFFKDRYCNQPPPNCSFVPDPVKEFEIKFDYKKSSDVPTYITPIVGDINNDGFIEVISMGMKGFFPHGSSTSGEKSGNILIFDGRSGQLIREIETPLMAFQGPTPIVIGDINIDGNAEIIISTMDYDENLLNLRPSALVRVVNGAPYSSLFSVIWDYNSQIFTGINYETKSSIAALIGFKIIQDFNMGYAIDHSTNGLARYTKGSHTVFLSFKLDDSKRKSILPYFYY